MNLIIIIGYDKNYLNKNIINIIYKMVICIY